MSIFDLTSDGFAYNGQKVSILSGAVHYFRVVPEYWRDRLLKLKACGLNTVETYIPWNLHEPRPGKFCFDGMADVVRFIQTAAELDLFVILRPAPYICAEWEFGGLPSWLLAEPDMRLRCYNKAFLDRVDAYYDVLMPKLRPLLCTNGGPVIAVQIENEYGSYGNDKKYMEYLKNALTSRGIDVLLFTSDGPTDQMLQGGTLPDVLKTVNFGSHPEGAFEKLAEYQSGKPLMCMEFWLGWFDQWGKERNSREAGDVADAVDRMLKADASFNLYMFHGGTNFGFYNGALLIDKYMPTITSYDYGALLDEAGDPTDKYFAVRDVISKYKKIDYSFLPQKSEKKKYGLVKMSEQAGLFESLHVISTPVKTTCPEPMEKLGQDYGFILYTTFISGPRKQNVLTIQDVHDRALIFLDEEFVGIIERWNDQNRIVLDIPENGAKLGILVENMGRINYGAYLRDMKGITEGVRLDLQFQFDWTCYMLPMDDLSRLEFGNVKPTDKPVFYKGILQIDEPGDTFIDMEGWTKGIVYINGFNLGRYWNIGPQKTLYVPGPLLKKGRNEIIIFELHRTDNTSVNFIDTMVWGNK